MSLILNIDTALERASVCLARNGVAMTAETSDQQRDHAAWLHPAIERIMAKDACKWSDLTAVAVSIGPGSYTGLRVGLSTAKGFCFALGIPLITVGTLEIIAATVQDAAAGLICPLIDARRMEVYAALYDKELNEIMPPYAFNLEAGHFQEILDKEPVLFCGNGSPKVQSMVSHPHASFSNSTPDPLALSRLSYRNLKQGQIADLAYSEPLYIKEFYTPARRN